MSSEITLGSANFDAEVVSSKLPVLVDFWAVWCGPCKMLAPTVAELAEAYSGKIKVGKVNIDDEPDLANRFGIVSIPTLLIFKDGQVVNKQVGLAPRHVIEEMLKDL